MQADQLVNLVLTTVTGISVLFLVSIGLAVIFGMMRVINLAHGEFLMLGAFATLFLHRAGAGVWLSMLLAALAVGVLGLVVERLLIQHLYGRLADTMLATWGLSLILVQAVVLLVGPATQGIATPLGHIQIGRFRTSQYSLVLIGAALGMLAVVGWVLLRTRYGAMARAAVQLPEMASSVGIDTRRVNMLTFAFGSALAGAGGALVAPVAGVVPSMGQAFIARAFMTVIVGGPAAVSGTASASLLLGGVENLVAFLARPFWGQGALLIVAILLLRLMPTGLSGRWVSRL